MEIVSDLQQTIANNKVVVFSSETCPHCVTAKDILGSMNIDFEVVDVKSSPGMIPAFKQVTNHRTIPCIYVNQEKIGGCSDLKNLIESGHIKKIFEAADIKYTPYLATV